MLKTILKKFKKNRKTKVAYNSRLISKFHKDHQKVIKIVEKINKAINSDDKKAIVTSLKELKMTLLGHFMEEDMMLYQYLKEYYKDVPVTYELIVEFYESIKDIQRTLLNFLDKYLKNDLVAFDKIFESDFKAVVEALSHRVESEECSLYTLYIK